MKRTVIITLVLACIAGAGMSRYPVGRPVPVEIYTMAFTGNPCDPNDPSHDMAYRYLQMPNESWTEKFGANERTLLIHTISKLRVVVAAQGRRLMELEGRLNTLSDPNIPVSISAVLEGSPVLADPNEVKE